MAVGWQAYLSEALESCPLVVPWKNRLSVVLWEECPGRNVLCFSQDVEAWMTSRDLPRKLRHETVAFFCDAWVGQAGALITQLDFMRCVPDTVCAEV